MKFLRRFNKPSGDLGRPWLVVFNTLGIFIISQFLALLVVGIVLNLVHPDASLDSFLSKSAPVQFFYVALAESLSIGLVVLLVKKTRRLSLAFIGLGRRPK